MTPRYMGERRVGKMGKIHGRHVYGPFVKILLISDMNFSFSEFF